MEKTKNIEYKYSIVFFVIGLLFIFLLSTIFCLASYILIIKDFYSAIIIFIWLLYGLLFRDLIPKLIRTGNNLLKNKSALVLTENYLIDNINNKTLKWSDIEKIEQYYDVRSGDYIAIKVSDPDKYLSQEKSDFNRIIMKLNNRFWNGTFAIRPRELKCSKNELLTNLKTFLKKNK